MEAERYEAATLSSAAASYGSSGSVEDAHSESTGKKAFTSSSMPCTYSLTGFANFIKSHPLQLFVTLIFLLLGFGRKLFSNAFSIDTEEIISRPNELYNSWIALERFGLIALKRLTGTYWYNNSLASVLMVLFLALSALTWSYLVCGLREVGKFDVLAFSVPFVASPILAEMLGFLLVGPEVAMALAMVATALMWVWNGIVRRQWGWLAAGALLAAAAFSLYLAMATIFVLGTAFIIFCQDSDRNSVKSLWRHTGLFALVFMVAYVLYAMANKFVMSSMHIGTDPYIDNQSRWGKSSLSIIVGDLFKHAKDIYTGTGLYYTKFFTILCPVFLAVTIILVCRRRISLSCFLIAAMITLSPIMMAVILGGEASVRTEMTYTLAFAFMIKIILGQLPDAYLSSVVSLVVVIVIGCNQAFIVNRIFYTEDMVFEKDVAKAQAYVDKLDKFSGPKGSDGKTVVFIGNSPVDQNPSMLAQDSLIYTGRSVLSIGYSTLHGTWVKDGFITATVGRKYVFPSNRQIHQAEKWSSTMHSWPSQDSVSQMPDGTLVVKLSEVV